MIIGISGKIGSGKDTVGQIIQYLISCNKDKPAQGIWAFDNYVNTSNWEIKKFAGKLKQIVSILTGIPVENLEKQEVKDRVLGEEWWYYNMGTFNNKPINFLSYSKYKNSDFIENWYLIKPTVRQFLQEVGTEAMRNVIHPNIWVNALFVDYKEEFISKGIGGFHDTRIPNTKSIGYPNWIITDIRFPNELQAVKDRGGISIRINRPLKYTDDTIKASSIAMSLKAHPSEIALDNSKFDYTIDNNGTIEELIEKVREILIKEKII